MGALCTNTTKLSMTLVLMLSRGDHSKMGPFTDYGHTKAKSPNSLRPKFKSHSKINVWELDIKTEWFNKGIMDKAGTHSTPNASKNFSPKCLPTPKI